MRTRTRQHHRLASLNAFAGCTTHQIDTIDQLGTEIIVPAGASVWHEHRTEAQFIIVLDGRVDLTLAGEPVATLRAGTWFGHDALLNGHRTEVISGTVTSPTRLLAFSKREFTSLLDAAPTVAATLRATETSRAASTQHHDTVTPVRTNPAPVVRKHRVRRNPITTPALASGGVR